MLNMYPFHSFQTSHFSLNLPLERMNEGMNEWMNEWIPLSRLLLLMHLLLLSGLLPLSPPCQSRRNSVTLLDESRLHLGWCNNAKQKCRWGQNVTVVSDIISYMQMGPLRVKRFWSAWPLSSSPLVAVNNIIPSGKNNKYLMPFYNI